MPFPVVGIGASAGGLEAFIELMKAMPADIQMAFVLVQHLPPDVENLTASILGKHTTMPVMQVTDGLEVRPDHVYVICPGHTMTIRDGRLHLGHSLEKPGHRRPVDDFFRSLAEEQLERAVAIIMSGLGSNGTAGAKMIRAAGGICIAQDPDSAKNTSMPRALIESGLADFVLRPAEIPDLLLRYVAHPYAKGVLPADTDEEQQAYRALIALLRAGVRHDFSGYKKPFMLRRILRRLMLHKLSTIDGYVRMLRQDPAEVNALAEELMIHVTGFFRDTTVWEALRDKVIGPLVTTREAGAPIRAWVSACASGEEAYTLALLLVEAAEAAGKEFDVKIFATDTAETSLAQARAGIFHDGIESEVSPERLSRFFDREGVGYRVKKTLRELVVFDPQNLLQDPPYSRLDICICRNLLIYLEPAGQRRALQLMHFALREGGALVLGSSENIGELEALFQPLDQKAKIFTRISSALPGSMNFPVPRRPAETSIGGALARPKPTIGRLVEQTLLSQFTPVSVLIDADQHIVHFHGSTERYLDQPRGDSNRDLLVLVREPLVGALRSAIHRAMTDGGRGSARSGWTATPGARSCVEIVARKLDVDDTGGFCLVSFVDIVERNSTSGGDMPAPAENRLRLETELKRGGGELRSTIAELKMSHEDLRVANGESTSVNEELQSTNEERETSKEELQSLNEEMTAVNSQLQLEMDELESATNDLATLLANTEIAVLHLDLKLNIRRFTPSSTDLFDLIPSDAGRPLAALAPKFIDPDFLDDAQQVAETWDRREKQIKSDAGRIYLRRTLPYRRNDHRVDGIVITFVDVTRLTQAEDALRENEQRCRLILDGIRDHAIFLINPDGLIATWPNGAEQVFGYTLPEAVGRSPDFLYNEVDRIARVHEQELARARASGSFVEARWQVRKDGSQFWGEGTLSPVITSSGRIDGFVKVLRDNTNQKLSAEALKQAKREAEAANAARDHFLATVSHELRTPLTPMMLWAQILDREETSDRPLLREGLEMIRKCAEEQHELIENLVDTSRIVTRKLRLDRRPTDLLPLVQTAVDLARPTATAKGLGLESSLDPSAGTGLVDPGRLLQVIANLLNNAVKFTPTGGKISLALRRTGETVEIQVKDNGRGITPEFLPRLFNRFDPMEDSTTRVASGLGLGLSIARQLVELHHGTITAQSQGEDCGATFIVTLPVPTLDSTAGVGDEDSSPTPASKNS